MASEALKYAENALSAGGAQDAPTDPLGDTPPQEPDPLGTSILAPSLICPLYGPSKVPEFDFDKWARLQEPCEHS